MVNVLENSALKGEQFLEITVRNCSPVFLLDSLSKNSEKWQGHKNTECEF